MCYRNRIFPGPDLSLSFISQTTEYLFLKEVVDGCLSSVHRFNGLQEFEPVPVLGKGVKISLYAPLLGHLFGMALGGSLLSVLTFGYGLLGGCGPLIYAVLRETTGHYNSAALVSVVCYAIAAVVILLVRPMKAGRSQ
jgi:hypothetical protein